jgi:hypothetical protein
MPIQLVETNLTCTDSVIVKSLNSGKITKFYIYIEHIHCTLNSKNEEYKLKIADLVSYISHETGLFL